MTVNLLALSLTDLLSSLHLFTVQFHRVENDKIRKVFFVCFFLKKNVFKQMFDINVKVKVREEIKYIHI